MKSRWGFMLNALGVIVLIAGVLIATLLGGDSFSGLTALGTALVGLGLALIFMDSIISGRVVFDRDTHQSDTFTGIADRLWGLVMVLFGLLIILFSLAQFLVPGLTDNFLKTGFGLGILLVVIGSAAFFYSVIQIIGSDEERESLLGLDHMTCPAVGKKFLTILSINCCLCFICDISRCITRYSCGSILMLGGQT